MSDQTSARPGTGGFFSLFDLRPTVFEAGVLEELARAMASAQLPGSTRIDSGYVYLGQFIAHDVSKLDPPSRELVPAADLVQLRTPALDLDTVYGAGFCDPSISVDTKTGRMRLGRVVGSDGRGGSEDDLPRDRQTRAARIGDDRNDENLLVAQLHLQFLKLHNFFVERIRNEQRHLDAQQLFGAARQQTILHYQQVVLYDFLDTILDPRVWEYVIGNNRGSLWDPTRAEAARMPVEFSAAAFRFGHSMVRPGYTINETRFVDLGDLFTMTGPGGLGGQHALPDTHIVDWRLFFFDCRQRRPQQLPNVGLPIDPCVAITLSDGALLAAKNLRTGNRSLLPDAQTLIRHVQATFPGLASAINLRQLTPDELSPRVGVGSGDAMKFMPLLDLLGDDFGLQAKTPLWYYILAEAHTLCAGQRLGPLGSLIVAEVLRALVRLSRPSILHRHFQSNYIEATKDIHGRRYLRMTDLLNAVGRTGL
jgi:hypothetical protein